MFDHIENLETLEVFCEKFTLQKSEQKSDSVAKVRFTKLKIILQHFPSPETVSNLGYPHILEKITIRNKCIITKNGAGGINVSHKDDLEDDKNKIQAVCGLFAIGNDFDNINYQQFAYYEQYDQLYDKLASWGANIGYYMAVNPSYEIEKNERSIFEAKRNIL